MSTKGHIMFWGSLACANAWLANGNAYGFVFLVAVLLAPLLYRGRNQ